MPKKTVTPTRMELSRLKKRLETARRGHKLLKDKRDELMRQFLILVRENKDLREKVEEGIKKSNKSFAFARSSMSEEALNVALLSPRQRVYLEVNKKNVMSVDTPRFGIKTGSSNQNDIYCYGYGFTSADLDMAVEEIAELVPDMLRLAECEKSCLLMATEIEKTRRRVNALEHVMIPEYEENIKYIRMKLDENERSSQVRLIKVKDMLLEDTHKYSTRTGTQGEYPVEIV